MPLACEEPQPQRQPAQPSGQDFQPKPQGKTWGHRYLEDGAQEDILLVPADLDEDHKGQHPQCLLTSAPQDHHPLWKRAIITCPGPLEPNQRQPFSQCPGEPQDRAPSRRSKNTAHHPF